MARQRLVLVGFVLATGLVLATEAAAMRPGGGSSFGGGGGGGSHSSGGGGGSHSSSSSSSGYRSSSSSGGSSGEFGPAALGILFVFFALAGVRIAVQAAKDADAWSSYWRHDGPAPISHEEAFRVPRRRPPSKRTHASLEALREHDPNFSQILLEDFLYELYTRAQEARGSEVELARLAPYLDPFVRDALASRGLRQVLAVSGVIVGAMQITKLELRDGTATIDVEYETNYTETYPSGSDHAEHQGQLGFYAKERWSLQRKLSAQSHRPDETRSFGCPSCGAPVEQDATEACRHCGAAYGTHEFDWCCTLVELEREETRGPALGGYAPEVGTHGRTVRATDLDAGLAALQRHDPAFDREQFLARVDMIYHQLNEAWSSLCWEDARPYLSDRLWLSMRYWIHAYRQQDLQNHMEHAKVERTELAKVVLDPFFHAITVRVWASAIDTTVHRPTGMVVGGNADEPRKYSEYWTFIRSAQRRGAASTDAQCPSCGAPLSINMAGSCEHCGVKLTAGQFDWVLSKIEQDEAYRG